VANLHERDQRMLVATEGDWPAVRPPVGVRVEPFPWVSANGLGDLQMLWEEGEVAFGRGWRDSAEGRRDDVLVALPISAQPTRTTLDRLNHEYSFKEELDSAWAVRPLELLHDRGRTVLVFEDYPGGEPLSGLLGTPMDIECFLRLAVFVASALDKVHRRGLIHKDIKPANIMVNPANGEVRLTGFGIASRLAREKQSAQPPEFIDGTLAYMAPEQTGRMNRSTDSRSDLYALGVTFYEMLTGSLPFTATDPMDWVHCHIARTPMRPQERAANVPAVISAIIMKLLAKEAGERYQTAAGLERDLGRCLTEWLRGSLAAFALGENDVPDRLLIPEKLYGREREVETLLACFARTVRSGKPELVLVSGYSGVGKSSVVHELHKVLTLPRGLFAAGKFDQHRGDIPYATVVQAFQGLVRHILGESEAELGTWRGAFRDALGSNGLLIVELIPELELVIGKQPAVPDLSPQFAQHRFQTVLRRFIAVFARPEHPLVLFLDDLQWLDTATLDLLEDILAHQDIRHLLLIGAYRDNEVDATHPLMRKLDAIRGGGTTVHDIVLAPLRYDDLRQLVVDSLRCETGRADPLVQLVQDKTGGNPLFASQFLHALADEALLVFDHRESHWSWDLGRIHAKRFTDNVVDLMVVKLNRLPLETREALRHLACVGSGAAFALLGTVCELSQDGLHNSLWEAVRSGLVLRAEGSYAFQHDRIQEAAYSLIPELARAETHLRIGRLLLTHTPSDRREDIIFEIANQFNRGAGLVTSEKDCLQVAEINLSAGRRAKASAAYASALQYFIAGGALLTSEHWDRRHDLMFQLEFHRAECEFLTGEPNVAAERLTLLRSRTEDNIELAMVACLGIDVCMTLAQIGHAVAICLDYLHRVGIECPVHPTEEQVRHEYERVWLQLGGRAIEELVDIPLMTDAESIATLDVLTKGLVPALFSNINLRDLMTCRAVSLSIEHGNHDGSCLNYVWLSVTAGHGFGDYKNAFRLGQLGFDLVEKRGLKRFQAAASQVP
jgi:predicted ATPase